MIELELLGANGDQVVMTDQHGERYSIVVDDALRAAVRRARPAALAPAPQPPAPGSAVRPRDLQALMRAGASAQEVAQATGLDIDHIRRFEGPVLAERAWAVEQARSCRIGWERTPPSWRARHRPAGHPRGRAGEPRLGRSAPGTRAVAGGPHLRPGR